MHAIACLSVCCAIGSPSAFGDLNDCDFPVTSDFGNNQSQTKEEVEAELVRELAMKLRQFDRCLDRQKATAGSTAGDSASASADGGPAGVASSGSGGQNPGDGIERTRPGGGTHEQAGDPVADAGNAGDAVRGGQRQGLPTGPAAPGPVAAASEASRPERPGRPGGGPSVPDNVVEDDVARILREAAEQETDPTRRAALWKEYENYVKNL